MSCRNALTSPAAGPSARTPVACAVGACAGLDAEDRALVDCIHELCAQDADIVNRAANDLTLYSRRPKRIELQRYDGTRWVTERTVTSGGTTRGSEVWINRGESCAATQETIYHEVMHTMPRQQSMTSRERELDAYTRTAQWMIDRGMPGRYQTRGSDGLLHPDAAAITRHVDGAYGYSSGELRVVGREGGGSTVVLEDGTRRPARAGDRFQHRPLQDLQERRLPPDAVRCP